MATTDDAQAKARDIGVTEIKLKHIEEARKAKKRFVMWVALVWVGIFAVLLIVFRQFNLDFKFMLKYLPFIMKGVGITIYISILSIASACILALFGALGRLSKNPIFYGVATFYISVIRGTPLIVQVFVN
jgi:polar amino acid transport system permease protein